jgi:hypothetical protein
MNYKMKKGGNEHVMNDTEMNDTEMNFDDKIINKEVDVANEQNGGRRRRRRSSAHKQSKKHRSTKRRSTKRRSTKRRSTKHRGGEGILTTAALPFGLLGLNNVFGMKRRGNRTHKRSSRKNRK